jgi:hypothetical protein
MQRSAKAAQCRFRTGGATSCLLTVRSSVARVRRGVARRRRGSDSRERLLLSMGRTGFVGQGTRGAVPRRRAGSSLRISRSFVAKRTPHKRANLGEARDLGFVSSRPNAAEPQPKRTSARTTNAPRFAVTDVILSAVHPALRARLSRPLVSVSGCYGCRTSA